MAECIARFVSDNDAALQELRDCIDDYLWFSSDEEAENCNYEDAVRFSSGMLITWKDRAVRLRDGARKACARLRADRAKLITDGWAEYKAVMRQGSEAGLTHQSIRDLVADYSNEDVSLGKVVEELRLLAVGAAQAMAKTLPQRELLTIPADNGLADISKLLVSERQWHSHYKTHLHLAEKKIKELELKIGELSSLSE